MALRDGLLKEHRLDHGGLPAAAHKVLANFVKRACSFAVLAGPRGHGRQEEDTARDLSQAHRGLIHC
ncbi:hypothetical protein AK812_SmicGene45017 [Symbiodinium microadriaticum]|uniref:Uncharacterized protein n=1 Tax=Symbiodinium microadriaticum TaxID=2951 RepID=A0A1Q9BWZ7_SYMMI|nr:hypothetical protein AK812_SmicGene45017 [Symbiodinium microadriaticum]